jgi:hypothetical protein
MQKHKHNKTQFSNFALMAGLKASEGNFTIATGLEYSRSYYKTIHRNHKTPSALSIVEIDLPEYQKLLQTTNILYKGFKIETQNTSNNPIHIIRKNEKTSDGKRNGSAHYDLSILTYKQVQQNDRPLLYNREQLIPLCYGIAESRFKVIMSDTTASTKTETNLVAESIVLQTILKTLPNIYSVAPQFTNEELTISSNAARFYLELASKLDSYETKEDMIAIIKSCLPETVETKYKKLYKEFRKVCDGADETRLLILLHAKQRESIIRSLPPTDNSYLLVERSKLLLECQQLVQKILPD